MPVGPVQRLVVDAQRRGLRDGLLGTSKPWLAVWVVLASVRLLQRLGHRRAIVYRTQLQPGEALLITHAREISDGGGD
jgi:hypothetical protein